MKCCVLFSVLSRLDVDRCLLDEQDRQRRRILRWCEANSIGAAHLVQINVFAFVQLLTPIRIEDDYSLFRCFVRISCDGQCDLLRDRFENLDGSNETAAIRHRLSRSTG